MKIAFEPIFNSGGELFAVECLTRSFSKKHKEFKNAEFFFKRASGESLYEIFSYQLAVIKKNHSYFLDRNIRVSINLNYRSIDFLDLETLSKINALDMLCLEVDVSDMQFLSADGIEFLNSLKNEIWLDDLDLKKEYCHLDLIGNITSVKIDKYSFWRVPSKKKLIKNLAEKFTSKKLKVIMEGVETSEQFSTLKENRFLYAQGYLFKEVDENSLGDLTLLYKTPKY